MKYSLFFRLLPVLAPCLAAMGQQENPSIRNPAADPKVVSQKAVMIKYDLLLPNDKSFEHVKDDERNPYGKSDDDQKKLAVKATSEENLIRDQLTKLRVSGAGFDENGDVVRVMLGDMILTTDQVLPPLIPGQTLDLQVGKLTPSGIELVWVDKKHTGLPPRKLTLPLDFRPVVHYRMQGQPNDKSLRTKIESLKGTLARQYSGELTPENTVADTAKAPVPVRDGGGAPEAKDNPPANPPSGSDAPDIMTKPAGVPANQTEPAVLKPVGAHSPEHIDQAIGYLSKVLKAVPEKPQSAHN